MATAAHDGVVPLSAADKRLEATLDSTKFACCDYLDNPGVATEASFSSATEQHVRALEGAALKKQAGHMRKVDNDFRSAKTSSKKRRIVEVLAKSLYNMTVKKLHKWGLAAAVSTAGIIYALYEIDEHGQLVGVSDVNLDGWTDEHRIDVDYDGLADYTLVDQDFDGTFDQLKDAGGGVLAEDGFLEAVTSMFEILFS